MKLIPFVFDWLGTLQGGPKEAKIEQKSILVAVKNEKRENVDFAHPSHAKSLLLGSHGGQESVPK